MASTVRGRLGTTKSPVIPWLLSPNAIFNQQHPWRPIACLARRWHTLGTQKRWCILQSANFHRGIPSACIFFWAGTNIHSLSGCQYESAR